MNTDNVDSTECPLEASNLVVFAPHVVFLVNIVLLVVVGITAVAAPTVAVVLMGVAAALGVTQLVIVTRESLVSDNVGGLRRFVSSGAFILGVGPLLVSLPGLLS